MNLDRRLARRRRRMLLCAMACAGIFVAESAMAVLGGDVSTVSDDEARMKGGMKRPLAVHPQQVQAIEIRMTDGSSIREYVGPNGIVFAVAWSTRFKPDLASLLGRHAEIYTAAATEALKTPGIRRSVLLQRGDLVVESASHLNTFVGKAYARSLVPSGVQIDELR